MEVLKSGDAPALVSNLEVMQLLQERIAERQDQKRDGAKGSNGGEEKIKKGPYQNRDWMERTVLNHLQSTPVGGADVNMDEMPKLVERLRADPGTSLKAGTKNGDKYPSGYGLTTAETLQILNHMPTSLVELHLLIEDIEKREPLDDEEKQTQFLRLIADFSGRPVEETEGNGGDDMETEGDGDD